MIRVHHKRLAVQGDFSQEFFDAAFYHFGSDVSRLAGFQRLLGVDVALFLNDFGVHFGFRYTLRFGRNDVHTHFAGNVFSTFELNQYAFGGQSTVDVGSQAVRGIDHLEATYRHVFAQFSDDGFTLFFNQSGQFFNGSRFFLGSGFGHRVSKGYKTRIFGNEVGFAVYFNQSAYIAFDGISQYAFSGGTAGQFTGFGAGFDAQDFFCFRHIAFGFYQGFFTFHHAQAGSSTQVTHHFCSNFCHVYLQIQYIQTERGTTAFTIKDDMKRGAAAPFTIPFYSAAAAS